MQYAGTLSWSGVGLGSLAAPSPRRVKSREQVAARPPAAGFGNHRAEAASAQAGPVADRTAVASVILPPQVEGRALEIDWSQLVRRCMDGDSSAWSELVRSQHKRVYGLCYRFTGNPTDAEDLTQDVFLKIYTNLASFDLARGSLQVWITTMTRNLLVDNYRRNRLQRSSSSLDEGWESTEELKPVDRLTSRAISPHESAAQKELSQMVQQALARVSVELREAVILRDLRIWITRKSPRCWQYPKGL